MPDELYLMRDRAEKAEAERDAALVRAAVLTEARHKAEADRELWREAKEKADVDVERAKAERDAAVERAAAREAWAAECLLENECLTAEREAALAQVAALREVVAFHERLAVDPADLSCRDAQMRAEGMRKAAKIAYDVAHYTDDIRKPRDAILAAAEKEAGNG